jgi:hypothetical protein
VARTLIVIAVGLGVLATVALASHVAGAPPNDDYLQSAALNTPGQRLERQATLKDVRPASEMANASVQADVFNPKADGSAGSGGPAEVTTCETTSYGKTVWYDFYPDVPGVVRIRANGYDSVISVLRFSRDSGIPDFAGRACINDSSSTQEELLTRVRKGRAYTIQLGGVNNASGELEFLFDFLADTDGDGVLDDNDNCPRLKSGGRPSGCPKRLRPEVTLRAAPVAGGIRVLGLTVKATSGSRIEVACTQGCKTEVKRARSEVSFRKIKGNRLSAGSKIEIRVSKRRAIGAYIAYRIKDGNFEKFERCMRPGSRKPRRRCR